ncbi:hypothetical protein D0Z03_001270 [Geotrichum reessii]|nr:hypothetical protein D0Z03_001270 [Galactomyces reessii]
MKFSAAAISIFAATAAMALPMAHEHNLHKRDVVTEVVHKTLVYYQKQVVYVDQNGNPFSTGVQVVSTSVGNIQPEATSVDGSSAQPTSSAEDVIQNVATSDTYVAPSRTVVPDFVSSDVPTQQPESTSEPVTTSDPAPTSTYEPAPTTSSEPAPTISSEAAPTTSSEVAPVSTTLAVQSSSAPASTPVTSSQNAAPSSSSSSGSSSGGSGSNAGDGTYYDTGLGACGITSTDSDFIVAISHARFDAVNPGNPNNNPLCGKKITAYRGGKSVQVTVVDRCPGCDTNSLDFSPAAFQALGSFDEGRIPITWDFN